MSYYSIVSRTIYPSRRLNTFYRLEVWAGVYGYVCDVYPKGSNEAVSKQYGASPNQALSKAKKWVDKNR